MTKAKQVHDGQAVYNKTVLSIYDFWVLGFSNHFLWKCPTKILREEFSKNASENHLDVGVGTGYYPDKCFSETPRRVALLDLNPNSLAAAAERLRRFAPELYRENVLEKFQLDCHKYDSISVNYLLHCVPGSIKEKSVLFSHLLPYLNPEGVVFGSTILGKGKKKNMFARKLMSIYNQKGIFHNDNDTLEDLESSLKKYFKYIDIRVVGSVAIFSARS